ncbi:MAG: hypothetical protein IMHGJWDQ_001835 [Candidatus Fervidibacter sp.]
MAEPQATLEEAEVVEPLRDTNVVIYHAPTKAHFHIRARIRKGSGQVFLNGTPLTELLENGRLRPFDELLNTLQRERLQSVDVYLEIDNPAWSETLQPPVLTYAVTKALTNLLGHLKPA